MKDHILAIQALLGAFTTYYVDVPGQPVLPYVLLWSTSGLPPEEQAVVASSDLTDTIGVTAVAGTPMGVLTLRSSVRAVLDGSHPAVDDRETWLNLIESRATDVDRGVTPHRAFGVDMYRLLSVPA